MAKGIVINPTPPPAEPEPGIAAIDIESIIERCNDAMARMSKSNPHCYLLYICASALRQMKDRLAMYEAGEVEPKPITGQPRGGVSRIVN